MSFTKIDNNNITPTGVVAGTYSTANITVNEQGQITSANSGGSPPSGIKITSIEITNSSGTVIDDTNIDLAGGYIKINGNGFSSGCQVYVNQTSAIVTTFVSGDLVTAQLPAMSAGTYILYLVNPDGATATRVNAVTYSATPVWVTASDLGTYVKQTSFSVQLSATGGIVYSLDSGSTLPGTLSLTSGGLLSGTLPDVVTNSVYTFSINARDNEFQDASRTFSIGVQPVIKSFNISPAVSGKSSWNLLNDGPLNLTTAGTWTITATNNFTCTAKVWGAAGGGSTSVGGGGGGYATGLLNITNTSVWTLVVGAGGATSATAGTGSGTGGSGGAGNGQGGAINGAGGGGGSGIFTTSTVSQANAILIGGGGGGATNAMAGGAAGGTSGLTGGGPAGGGGGTQSAVGGGGGVAHPEGAAGSAGSGMNGGAGGQGFASPVNAARDGGGGGGGGYFGGGGGRGGGGGVRGAGGGASGRISTNTSLVTSTSLSSASGINPGNSTDANRAASAGLAVIAANGGSGQIYIAF